MLAVDSSLFRRDAAHVTAMPQTGSSAPSAAGPKPTPLEWPRVHCWGSACAPRLCRAARGVPMCAKSVL